MDEWMKDGGGVVDYNFLALVCGQQWLEVLSVCSHE